MDRFFTRFSSRISNAAGQGLGLDVATERAGAVLSALGRGTVAALAADDLAAALGRRRERA